jgi:hypothetical protein
MRLGLPAKSGPLRVSRALQRGTAAINNQRPKQRPGWVSEAEQLVLITHATLNHTQRRKPWMEIAEEVGLGHYGEMAINTAFQAQRYGRRRATKKPLLTQLHKDNRAQ